MQIKDLEPHEQHALGGLIRMMIRSDGDFTEEEEEKVNAIGERLGGQALIWRTISASAQACQTDEQIRATVPAVVRPDARQLILDAIEQVAGSDGLAATEAELIDWVKQSWAG
jgi:hypothetical protein